MSEPKLFDTWKAANPQKRRLYMMAITENTSRTQRIKPTDMLQYFKIFEELGKEAAAARAKIGKKGGPGSGRRAVLAAKKLGTTPNQMKLVEKIVDHGDQDIISDMNRFKLDVAKAARRVDRIKKQEAFLKFPPEDSGILRGDAMAWLKDRPDNSVPFFVSDPPYGLGKLYDGWIEPCKTWDAYWNGCKGWDGMQNFFAEMKRVVMPGGAIILWQAYCYLDHLMSNFGTTNIMASCNTWRSMRMWEPIIQWTKPDVKPNAKPIIGGKAIARGRWFVCDGEDSVDAGLCELPGEEHPCPKSQYTIHHVVENCPEGTLVVDPFCGVGSIPLGCYTAGLAYIGIEQSKKYVAKARRRLNKAKSNPVATCRYCGCVRCRCC